MTQIPMAPASDARPRRLLLVVDAPSLLHRHHHACSHTRLLDRTGRPAWALHGMLRQILEAIESFAPDAVVFGLDDRAASLRRERYPGYKAGRGEKHPELIDQLERAGALLDALGLATHTPAGLEADDVNASGAAWAVRHGWDCVIITSDRDAFAHIGEHTRVLRLIDGGIQGSPLLTPARLHAMYGVAASNYLAYAALRGDASDNLPGVQGIGERSAAALLDVAGTMRAAWADVDHDDGCSLAAALDDWAAETGSRRLGDSVVRRLAAPGARDRYEFNVAMMAGRDDLDLGLTPDVPGTPGLLPLDIDRVGAVVGFLGVQATTDMALRVLTGDRDARERYGLASAAGGGSLVDVQPPPAADHLDSWSQQHDHGDRARSDRGPQEPAEERAPALHRGVAPAEGHRRVPGERGGLRRARPGAAPQVERDPDSQQR